MLGWAVDALVLPRQVVGHVGAGSAECEDREDVALDRIADHEKLAGCDPVAAQDAAIGVVILFREDLDRGEVGGETLAGDLALLVAQIPLGDHHEPV